MTIREFIEHVSTSASMEKLNTEETDIKFILTNGVEIDPWDIQVVNGKLTLSFE